MAEPGGETHPPAGAPAGPGPWADALSVGLLLARSDRLAWANARFAALAGMPGGAGALRGAELAAFFEDAGAGLPDWEAAEPGAGPVPCRLRPRHGGSVAVEVAALGAGPERGSRYFEVRDTDAECVLEAEVERASRSLRRTNRALARECERAAREAAEREELLGLVSHELRTPLTVIAGFNKLLLSERAGPLNAEQRHFLEESARSCRRLATFVGNLLGAARQAAGEDAPELREASLAETLEGVVRFLKPLVEERCQQVALELHPAAERARFDPLRLEQLLTNLLANAVRYTPVKGVIRVRSWPRAAAAVEVAVDDEGEGIPEAERERVFGAYVRGGRRRGGSGLGLGLALCRRIVEAHGGSIRADVSPEGGARVAFTLPAARDEEG